LLGKDKGARLAVGEVVLLEREEKHVPCRLKDHGQHVVRTSVCLDVVQIGEDDFGDLFGPAKSYFEVRFKFLRDSIASNTARL
jgi:hypothetical protein